MIVHFIKTGFAKIVVRLKTSGGMQPSGSLRRTDSQQ